MYSFPLSALTCPTAQLDKEANHEIAHQSLTTVPVLKKKKIISTHFWNLKVWKYKHQQIVPLFAHLYLLVCDTYRLSKYLVTK